MRIGIITHWRDKDNYGAALQSFALQRYLRDKGHDAFVIRYISVNPQRSLIHKVVYFIKNPFILIKIQKGKKVQRRVQEWNEKRDFDSFRESHVALSPDIYMGFAELQQRSPEAEIYITGSDQVWHGSLKNPQNRAFFLDFGSNKTIRASYAASFGRNYFPCEDELLFKELLGKFQAVSMREESGIEILRQLGIESIRCLDSTFLLSMDYYTSLMSERRHLEKFAFFYTVNVTTPEELYWDRIKHLMHQRGCKCVVTTGTGYKPAEELFEGAKYDYATVGGWLANIYYSDLVVTASFHGIALSYILKKDFIYMPLWGQFKKGNDRITDLLESVGLTDRIANKWEDVVRLVDKRINYSKIDNRKFIQLRQQSIAFLDKLTN